MRFLLVLCLITGAVASAKPLIITGEVPAGSPYYDYLERLEAYGCALPTFRAIRPLPYGNLFHALPSVKPQKDEEGNEVQGEQGPPPETCAAPKWLLKMRDLIRRGSFPIQLREDLYATHDDLVPLVGIESIVSGLYPLREGRPFFNGANLYSELGVSLGAGSDFGVAVGGTPVFLAAVDEYRYLDGRIFLQEAWVKGAYRRFEIAYGRFSQRFGEAKHGSMILSGAARPMTTLKFAIRPHTIIPLAFLGQVSLETWFSSEGPSKGIDDARYFGIEAGFRPVNWLELAFVNFNQYGGVGRPSAGASDLLKMAIFSNAPELETLRHRGYAFNIALWGPSTFFKVYTQLYMERFETSNISPLVGIYFPKLGEWEARFEYASTRKDAYTSPLYTQGFTTQNTPLGHPLGPDGEGFYLDIGTPDISEWRPVLSGFIETRMKTPPLSGAAASEKRTGGGLELNRRWENTEFGASIRYASIENVLYIPGIGQTSVVAGSATLRYNF